MGKFLLQGIKFIGIFILTYLFVFGSLFFLKKKNIPLIHRVSKTLLFWGGDTHKRFKEFDIKLNYDLLIIGSSHTYNSFDTRIFEEKGIRAYNLGTSGQSIENSLILARNYFHKGLSKNVILDIYPGAFMSSGLESTCDLIVNVPSNSAALDLAWSFPDIRSVNMLVLRLFYKLSNSHAPIYKDTRYRKGGFIAVRDSANTNIEYDKFLPRYKPKEEAINSLHQIIAHCKAIETKLILVAHPAPKELKNQQYLSFVIDAKKISEKVGLEFLDYSFNHNLNSKHHFYDVQHLNEAGAQIFTEKLIADLHSKELIIKTTEQSKIKRKKAEE